MPPSGGSSFLPFARSEASSAAIDCGRGGRCVVNDSGLVTLLLGGDVMLGRGIDQILPHPGEPELREPNLRDARGYLRSLST